MTTPRWLAGILAVTWMAFSGASQAVVLSHTVDGRDNLYNTAWTGNPYPGAINSLSALDARSVQSGASPFDFSPFDSVIVVADGLVVDAGATATDADGQAGLFRGLRVYSMIGLWSSTGTSITALGSPFFVGTSASLTVPNAPSAFLFLAENDGNFADNSGEYSVRLETVGGVAVSEPGALALLVASFAIAGAGGVRRRRVGG